MGMDGGMCVGGSLVGGEFGWQGMVYWEGEVQDVPGVFIM
jgi:hypothetical protein